MLRLSAWEACKYVNGIGQPDRWTKFVCKGMFGITNIWYVTYPTRTEVEQKSITMSRIQPWDWMGWERSRKFLIKCHFGQLNNLSQFRYILPVFLGEKCESGLIECQKSQAKESTWWFRHEACDVLQRPSSTYGLKYIAVILINDTFGKCVR